MTEPSAPEQLRQYYEDQDVDLKEALESELAAVTPDLPPAPTVEEDLKEALESQAQYWKGVAQKSKERMAPDPWEHRSERMLCTSCMWFSPKGKADLGRCRRRAPTMNGYPVVFTTDWCGDHKLNEVQRPKGYMTPDS